MNRLKGEKEGGSKGWPITGGGGEQAKSSLSEGMFGEVTKRDMGRNGGNRQHRVTMMIRLAAVSHASFLLFFYVFPYSATIRN